MHTLLSTNALHIEQQGTTSLETGARLVDTWQAVTMAKQ